MNEPAGPRALEAPERTQPAGQPARGRLPHLLHCLRVVYRRAVLVAAGGIAASVILFLLSWHADNEHVQAELRLRLDHRANEVQEALNARTNALSAARWFVQSSAGWPAPDALEAFARLLLQDNTGIEGIGWLALPPAADAAQPPPCGPIVLVLRHGAGEARPLPCGPEERAALQRAVLSRRAATTPALPLAPLAGARGSLIIAPVFEGPGAGPGRPKGFVAALVRAEWLLTDAETPMGLHQYLFFGPAPIARQLVATRPARLLRAGESMPSLEQALRSGQPLHALQLADQALTLLVVPDEDWFSLLPEFDEWFLLIVGIAASVVAGLVVGAGLRHNHRLELLAASLKQVSSALQREVEERNSAAQQLRLAHSIVNAIHESAPDGILVVTAEGQVLRFNQRFVEIWNIDAELLRRADDHAMLQAVAGRVAEPGAFIARVEYLYAHPQEDAAEDVLLADGRVLDRRSTSLRADGQYLGRVWFFRDVTEERALRERLRATLGRAHLQLEAVARFARSDALQGGDLAALAAQITRVAAEGLQCERVSFWRIDEAQLRLECLDLHDQTRGEHVLGPTLCGAAVQQELQALLRNGYVDAKDALHDERLAGFGPSYLVPNGVRSLLDVLVRVSGRPSALLSFEYCSRVHEWEKDEIAFAARLADEAGLALTTQELRRSESSLRVSEARFRLLFEEAPDAILVVDAQAGRVVDANRTAERLFECGLDHLRETGMPALLDEVAPDDAGAADSFLAQARRAAAGELVASELQLRSFGGRALHCELKLVRMPSESGQLVRVSLVDISERKRAEAALEQLARADALTGLPNRREFVRAVSQALARARRGDPPFAVLYLDLDHFKDVNDTLGHPAGDELLQRVSARLTAIVRAGDTVARFGGDEFAILATNLVQPENAAALADKVLQQIAQPFEVGAGSIHIRTSIGIAFLTDPAEGPEPLLSHADLALYKAKSAGRGSYRFYTDAMDTEARSRVSLAADLREALAGGGLFVAYQPQVDIATGRITGLEALVRWRHPRRGLVPPTQFVDVAETTGLVVPIGAWVLKTACQDIRAWLDAGIAPARVAVNVSAVQLKAPVEFERTLQAALGAARVPAGLLEIEITESTLMETSREHNDLLARMRSSGLRIAIDDFGTGYSSLDYLRRFPVDRIKIAQNFTSGIGRSEGSTVIVKAAVGLARALGMDVIAEGAETAQQVRLLGEWGCREVQGYFYAQPATRPAIDQLLARGRIEGAGTGQREAVITPATGAAWAST